jgi:hypothetical protein
VVSQVEGRDADRFPGIQPRSPIDRRAESAKHPWVEEPALSDSASINSHRGYADTRLLRLTKLGFHWSGGCRQLRLSILIVGRDRTHSQTVFSHPPRCHRACGFHRTRRPPVRTLTLVSFLTTSAGIPMRYHTIRQGRTLRHLTSCGPSPCARLSRAPTTMAMLTADMDLGGF